MTVRLTAAQQRAVLLIHTDDYRYHEPSGGARHRDHRPGRTPIIHRATLYALAEAGLVEYDPVTPNRLTLTADHGKAVLARLTEKKELKHVLG